MIMFYAPGSGLGHLTRARAVLNSFGLEKEATILTNSTSFDDLAVVGDLSVIQIPRELNSERDAFCAWVRNTIARLAPSELYIDAYPCGFWGEFDQEFFEQDLNVPTTYFARLLRFNRYKNLIPARPPHLSRTLLLEDLTPAHQAYVEKHCHNISPIDPIEDPPLSLSHKTLASVERILTEHPKFWLVVHSGNSFEVQQLVDYARQTKQLNGSDAAIVVVADELRDEGTDIQRLSLYPVTPLLEQAEKIFTACGYNSMRQLSRYAQKHLFIPFDRRFDDQYTRAARLLLPRIKNKNGSSQFDDPRLEKLRFPRRIASAETELLEHGYVELYNSVSNARAQLPFSAAIAWELCDGKFSFPEIETIVLETMDDAGVPAEHDIAEELLSVILDLKDKEFLA